MTNMKSRVLDLYGSLDAIELRYLQLPNEVILEFTLDGKPHLIRFMEPVRREPFLAVFDDCWGIRIHDINQEHQQYIEIGRYRVEFWDEDNPISGICVDRFEHTVLD